MRPTTPTLSAKQQFPGFSSRIPYIHLVFTNGSESYDYSGDTRLLSIDHREEPYRGYATIVLNNYDRAVPDMRGCHADIGYGDVTESGNEYCTTPRLWVVSQTEYSYRGVLRTSVYLVDGWGYLGWGEYYPGNAGEVNCGGSPRGAPDYHYIYNRDTTVFGLLEVIIEHGDFWLLDLPGETDGVIDSFMPCFEIKTTPYETRKEVIYRLINMTSCFLKQLSPRAHTTTDIKPAFEVVYPRETDEIDRTIQVNEFYSFQQTRNEVIPNRINVYAGASIENGEVIWPDPPIIGVAQDGEAVARLGGIQLPKGYQAPTLQIEADADCRAGAILTHLEMESFSGAAVIPHDCRIELYDYIAISDTRGM